jgi:hypothetical protein
VPRIRATSRRHHEPEHTHDHQGFRIWCVTRSDEEIGHDENEERSKTGGSILDPSLLTDWKGWVLILVLVVAGYVQDVGWHFQHASGLKRLENLKTYHFLFRGAAWPFFRWGGFIRIACIGIILFLFGWRAAVACGVGAVVLLRCLLACYEGTRPKCFETVDGPVCISYVYKSLEVGDNCQFNLKCEIEGPNGTAQGLPIVFSLRDMSIDSIKVHQDEGLAIVRAPRVTLEAGKDTVSIRSGTVELGLRLGNAIKRLGVLCGAKKAPF